MLSNRHRSTCSCPGCGTSGNSRTACDHASSSRGAHPAAAHVSDCNCDDDRDSVDMNRVGIPDVSTSIGVVCSTLARSSPRDNQNTPGRKVLMAIMGSFCMEVTNDRESVARRQSGSQRVWISRVWLSCQTLFGRDLSVGVEFQRVARCSGASGLLGCTLRTISQRQFGDRRRSNSSLCSILGSMPDVV